MPAVFDKTTKVGRRVPDPMTDKILCPVGTLSFPVINTTIALGIAIGVDVKIIHGDYFEQINGSVTINITGNLNTTIFQNEIRLVFQNQMITVLQNLILTVVASFIHTTIG